MKSQNDFVQEQVDEVLESIAVVKEKSDLQREATFEQKMEE